MAERRPDTSGDYGYDLVHEEVRAGRTSEQPTGSTGRSAGTSGTDDQGQDYGYDEAHDF